MINGSRREHFSSAEMGVVRDAAGVPHPPPTEHPDFDGSERTVISAADLAKVLRMADDEHNAEDSKSAS